MPHLGQCNLQTFFCRTRAELWKSESLPKSLQSTSQRLVSDYHIPILRDIFGWNNVAFVPASLVFLLHSLLLRFSAFPIGLGMRMLEATK